MPRGIAALLRWTALGGACLYVQVMSIVGDPGVKAGIVKEVALRH